MDNDNFTPDEFAEKADEVKSEIEKGLENVSESFENAAENAAAELQDQAEAAEQDFTDAAEDLKETVTETAEAVDEGFAAADEIPAESDAAEEGPEDDFPAADAAAAADEPAEKAAGDKVVTVEYTPVPQSEDVLQDPKTIDRHKPSIPQYVPKQYSREIPAEEPERAVRGAVNSSDYDGVPPVDDVEPAPRGTAGSSGNGPSGKVWIWVAVAVVVLLLIMVCCFIQGAFGFLNYLAR